MFLPPSLDQISVITAMAALNLDQDKTGWDKYDWALACSVLNDLPGCGTDDSLWNVMRITRTKTNERVNRSSQFIHVRGMVLDWPRTV